MNSLSSTSFLFRSALLVACALVTGCDDDDNDGGPPRTGARTLIASGTIDQNGGEIRLDNLLNEFHDVGIRVPAGALSGPTEIRIFSREDDPESISAVHVLEYEPTDLVFATDVELTLKWSLEYMAIAAAFASESDLVGFGRDAQGSARRVFKPIDRSIPNRTITISTRTLGKFFAMHGLPYRTFHQTTALLDPATPVPFEEVGDGVRIQISNGSESRTVGKGSLTDFWKSPASANLLVIHGLQTNPIDFTLAEGFLPADAPTAGLNADFRNIVTFQYASGRAIEETANALYDLIAANRGADFGTKILAHSSGGLVARYLIERSHADTSRPGFQAGDESLENVISDLVMIATPNQGAELANFTVATFLQVLEAGDGPYIAGISDLEEGPTSFTANLNNGYVNPATIYWWIAGDIGGDTDGAVSVSNVLDSPSPRTAPEEGREFEGDAYGHGDLGFAPARGGVLEQVRDWTRLVH